MRTLRVLSILFVAMMLIFAGGTAYAAGRGGSHHSGGYYRGGHEGHHGHSDFDVVIGGSFWGAPWYYPYYYPYYPYYYPYYYSYAPEFVERSTPQEYIERSQDESSSGPSGSWYYCPKSRAYYPYVKECPGGWQKVPAQPPSESGR